MRIRNLQKRREQLKEKFLLELPVSERHRYVQTVSIFVDATIHSYLFEGYSGEALVYHLVDELPALKDYEHSAYPHESLEKVVRSYAMRVEKKFSKYVKKSQGFGKI